VTRHRFINDGVAPIPMGGTAEYACVCGKRGTYAVIERHVAAETDREAVPIAQQEVDTDAFGGDTKAHYFPNAPRKPAPTTPRRPTKRPDTPEPLPPPPSTTTADLPEIGIPAHPHSIAELFQAMLRAAFQAGTAATTAGETFETWYQREVLR
jgi:hypothetical protein